MRGWGLLDVKGYREDGSSRGAWTWMGRRQRCYGLWYLLYCFFRIHSCCLYSCFTHESPSLPSNLFSASVFTVEGPESAKPHVQTDISKIRILGVIRSTGPCRRFTETSYGKIWRVGNKPSQFGCNVVDPHECNASAFSSPFLNKIIFHKE